MTSFQTVNGFYAPRPKKKKQWFCFAAYMCGRVIYEKSTTCADNMLLIRLLEDKTTKTLFLIHVIWPTFLLRLNIQKVSSENILIQYLQLCVH